MIKKVVVAPDSFKGTMSSQEICEIVKTGVKKYYPDAKVVKIPVADGGEGTVDAYLAGNGGKKVYAEVTAPMGEKVRAMYGILDDGKTAVIEMAQASGLPLVTGARNPLAATSFGTGELICDAVRKGCTKIILGIGGSATVDGGIGAAAAIGAVFADENGDPVTLDGAGMGKVCFIDGSGIDEKIKKTEIIVACDVKNPLLGKNGATYVFGPQKGADEKMLSELEKNMEHFCGKITEFCGKSMSRDEGMGAAGGICLGLRAFLDIKMASGIDIVLDTAGFEDKIKDADMVITGEGKIDGQSKQGKVPFGVASRAKKLGVPVIAIVGDVGEGYKDLYEDGITAIFSTNKAAVPFEKARLSCKEDLEFLVDSLFAFRRINDK